MRDKYDAVIIGAGLAGLRCARLLAAEGASVLLADRKEDLSTGVHTTGIFVRKTFEDFRFPAGSLGKPVSRVSLYSPSLRRLDLESGLPEFRIGRMGALYNSILEECVDHGVDFLGGTSFLDSRPDPRVNGGSVVRLRIKGENKVVRTKVLIGADGTGSAVARDLNLDRNREWIVGYEEVLRRRDGEVEPALHCVLDADLAPGYIAWIADDGEECHIGVGGYPERFDPKQALKEFKETVAPLILETEGLESIETRGGRIPVGGVLKKISNRRGILIGDAAGAVSPLTAGGLDPCLRLSEYAAETVLARLLTGEPALLKHYSGRQFRSKFAVRLVFRSLLRVLRFHAELEMVFWLLTTRPGLFLAEKVFFRRASFPDISVAEPVRRAMIGKMEAGRRGGDAG